MRLRWRLFVLALLLTVPLLALVPFVVTELRKANAHEAHQDAQRLAASLAREHETLVESARQLLSSLSHVPQVISPASAGCPKMLAAILGERPMFANLAAASPDGAVYCSAIPAAGPVNVRDMPDFARAIATRRFAAGDYIVGKIVQRPIFSAVFPVLDRDGEVAALLYAGFDLGWMAQNARAARLPDGSTLTLFDTRGRVLVRHPVDEGWVGNDGRALPEIEAALARRQPGSFEAAGRDRIARLYAVADVRSEGRQSAFLVIGIPREVVYAQADLLLHAGAVALAFVILIAALLSVAGSEALVLRPVRAIAAAARRISAGDFAARSGIAARGDELGELTSAFDEMAAVLQGREAAAASAQGRLAESEGRLQFAMQAAGMFGWEWRVGVDELHWTTDPAQLLGPPLDGPRAYPDFRALVHPEDRERFLEAGRGALAQRGQYDCEFRIIRTDGKVRWLMSRGRIAEDAKTGELRLVGVSRDVTERKQAEIAVRESELRLRSLMDGLQHVAVQGYDAQRRVIYWNPASERLYGWGRQQALRRRLEELTVPPESREQAVRAFAGLVGGGSPIAPARQSLLREDGSRVEVWSSFVMQPNTRGEPEVFRVDLDLGLLGLDARQPSV
jgi:PAS domain S-box-containing protein